MPNKYSIIIQNKYNKTQQFLLFNEKPTVSSNTGHDIAAFNNVWATAPGVHGPNGKTQFDIIVEEYAVCVFQEVLAGGGAGFNLDKESTCDTEELSASSSINMTVTHIISLTMINVANVFSGLGRKSAKPPFDVVRLLFGLVTQVSRMKSSPTSLSSLALGVTKLER
ncbi:hypothetical protein BDV97DRAFT_407561 [Delphinella strobiligena]|nr:hypothetical protein BDV97DRAFT_407561 [Delphinella strobiligena]